MVQIASGREHAYALDDSGRIWAWGDNRRGAVGDGTSTDRPTPVRLSLTDVAEVEAGHYHGIARRNDGTVWTWGYGALGQLGLGTTNNRTAPVQVPGITDAVAVAALAQQPHDRLGGQRVECAGGLVGDEQSA